MIPSIQKLFPVSPEKDSPEVFSELLSGGSFRLEHIQSYGDASPDGFWYDQEQTEWVALIAGQATLAFEEGLLKLVAGDALLIPAHVKHRVQHTSTDAVWIALHHFSNQQKSLNPD